MTTIAIIGGGNGGLCLAQGLARAGIDFTVYERDATVTSREQGYRVHIDPNGSAALAECLPEPLWNAFVATAGEAGTAGFGFLTEKLAPLCLVEPEIFRGGHDDPASGHHAASRVTLRQILLAGLGDRVRFGKEFVDHEQLDDGRVRVNFADGTSAEADFVVAADGANSRLRRRVLPAASRVDVGAMGIGGKLPLAGADWLPHHLAAGLNVIMPPRDFLFTAAFQRRHTETDARALLAEDIAAAGLDVAELFRHFENTDYMMWAFVLPTGTVDIDSPGTVLRDLVLERARDWDERLRRVLAETAPDTINAFAFRAATKVKPWPTGNITLLGDAIHSMPPTGGVGANTALRDAALLCRALTDVDRGRSSLREAVAGYEKEMLKHGFAAVDTSVTRARQALSGRIARLGGRTFMRVCGAVPPLRRAVFKTRWTEPPRTGSDAPPATSDTDDGRIASRP
ncbi:FAD-dependent oxidoreductase [Stackebrandtia nassauensis]|uniref:Monooxygenase FAD-binding protein n=1 Tax=Stackebrandtia nassauensis (strain DSM 44728 / CIP 108903 / NRRL B-16338 / NBRC 102104 / LLR-40K-21) TaxID=446470 RepID=D3PZQ2_STANL|nr:NAD(P)/FAD-dependent oxidoreductase [Stackebrandtia nassauensis]ADD43589.1 monooxygenase FAD-binding protein [Stackebrandtia nassauensis DSM 44728]